MKGPNYIHCITGEINAVLCQMKLSTRYTSVQRFYKEIPIISETPLMRTFKSLHERISMLTDLEGIDPMEYFGPFLDLVENPETPADLTFVALSSIDKFILYGLVTKDTTDAIIVINNIADALCKCSFESTYSTTEESVYQYLLDIILNCIRCNAGVLLTNKRAWSLIQCVYKMAFQSSVTPLLQKSAINTLTHAILTFFSRLRHPESLNCEVLPQEKPSYLSPKTQLSISSPRAESLTPTEMPISEVPTETPSAIEEVDEGSDNESSEEDNEVILEPYGLALLQQILLFLINLTSIKNKDIPSLRYGLNTINLLLEMYGDILVNYDVLVELLQGSFCKYIIQNTQNDDMIVLASAMRVIFNLFSSMKSFLKVQLEVFFTSVHIRLADTVPTSAHEFLPKEASLESLLDFCQEPTVMIDLYMNYDCDTQCTNLYERLCDCLYVNAMPDEDKPLTCMNTLAFQGLLAIIHSLAQRCTCHIDNNDKGDKQKEHNHVVLKRRHRKKILHEFAKLFNQGFKKEDWINYLIKENLITSKEDYQTIAELLRETTEIDQTVLGEALAFSSERNPFLAKLRFYYIRTFSFTDMPLDMILRTFLGTFRICGEAQAIDRIMDDLSVYVYETNPGPFLSASALFSLLFSCLLLNTDLHNPGVKNRMTFDDFCRNNKGINDGEDFPSDYLHYLYDSIKNEEIKLLSSSTDELDLSRWEENIQYRANKVSEAAFMGGLEDVSAAGDCELEMFGLIQEKAFEAMKMILSTSQDEQLLTKTLAGLQDYLQIALFFDEKSLITSYFSYLTTAVTTLISQYIISSKSSPSQTNLASLDEEDDDIDLWKCIHTTKFLFKTVIQYSSSLETEWKSVIDLLFWLDARSLLPESPTLLDIASPDNTVFPSLVIHEEVNQTEERGIWNTLSSLFVSEVEIIPFNLQQEIKESLLSCNLEEIFTRSNRLKVNSWVVLFNALISADHASALSESSKTEFRLTSLYTLKLHWLQLLLSKNIDRIGMVWGLVISFLERIRSIAIEMDFKYVLERLIVEDITLINILLNKPQLSEQALSLLSLLEPIPSHACLSSRRIAGLYYLLDHFYPYLLTPSNWKPIVSLLLKDANNEYGRPLVWQVLCRLLQEKMISVINFIPVLKCCLKTIDGFHDETWAKQIIEFVFALTMYIKKSPVSSPHIDSIDSVDNIPSLDQCWLQCITVLSSFANNVFKMSSQVTEFATDRLQRAILRRGDSIPSGPALLKCFDSIMLPLLQQYGKDDRSKSYIIGIMISSLLASSDELSKQSGFTSLWLRFIDILCKYIQEGGCVGETTIERMKNLLLVMTIEKRFDIMSDVAGQNVLDATMTMLDSYCPSIRADLDAAFNTKEEKKEEVKEESTEEVKEVVEEKKEEQTEEVKEVIEVKEEPTEEVKEQVAEVKEQVTEAKEEQVIDNQQVQQTEVKQEVVEEQSEQSEQTEQTEVKEEPELPSKETSLPDLQDEVIKVSEDDIIPICEDIKNE